MPRWKNKRRNPCVGWWRDQEGMKRSILSWPPRLTIWLGRYGKHEGEQWWWCEYSQRGARVQKEQPRLRNYYSFQLVLPLRGRLGTAIDAATPYHGTAASSAEFKQWCLPQNRSLGLTQPHGTDPAGESWGMSMAGLAEALKIEESTFSS